MSMIIDEENKILRIDVPNSEANINAQHCGIKDRTVGAYYMSENYNLCSTFLCGFSGEYLIDLSACVTNAKRYLDFLIENNYSKAFKNQLTPQLNALEAMKWLIKNNESHFYKICPPFVNENQKYMKLDNNDATINLFKTLVLGDLVSIYIRKVGENGFILYLDKNPKFKNLIDKNVILNWME